MQDKKTNCMVITCESMMKISFACDITLSRASVLIPPICHTQTTPLFIIVNKQMATPKGVQLHSQA